MKRYTVDDVERLFRSDVTADEINSLFRAAANGDKAAIKRIDKYCRELWRDHPDLAAEFDMPKSCAEALETSKKLKAKITATIDDPISRIIHARLEQIRQNNDPVLSAILDMDGQEFRQAVYKRMGQPVALPPQNTPKLPLDKAHKVKKPKRPTTIAKWQRDWKRIEPLFRRGDDIQKIAHDLGMSRDTVSDIIEWATSKDTT